MNHALNHALNRMIFPAISLASIAAASLLLTACSEPPAPAAVVKPVFVTTVTPANSAQTRSFTSVVRARVETELGLRTGGKVVERLVEVGDSVKAGQVLARLDPADYQLAVKAAADQMQAASVDAQQAASDDALDPGARPRGLRHAGRSLRGRRHDAALRARPGGRGRPARAVAGP